jgi:sugar phosphate isomerase/epimerase
MKLGFLTAPFPDTALMDVADWAASAGFEVLEIACWPAGGGEPRRYAGTSHIDVANLSAGQATEIREQIEAKGLAISGLGFYPNPLHPDPAHRAEVIGHLRKVIEAAEKMDLPLVNTFMGGDSARNQDQNWEEALRVWPGITAAGSPSRTVPCCSPTTSGPAGTTSPRPRACGDGSWSSGPTRSG